MCLSSLAKTLPSLHSMGLSSRSPEHVVELSFDFLFLFFLNVSAVVLVLFITQSGGPAPHFAKFCTDNINKMSGPYSLHCM